ALYACRPDEVARTGSLAAVGHEAAVEVRGGLADIAARAGRVVGIDEARKTRIRLRVIGRRLGIAVHGRVRTGRHVGAAVGAGTEVGIEVHVLCPITVRRPEDDRCAANGLRAVGFGAGGVTLE